MKNHITTIFIAAIIGFLGGVCSHYFYPEAEMTPQSNDTAIITSNPFQIKKDSGIQNSGIQIRQLQQQIQLLETRVTDLSENLINNNKLLPDEKLKKQSRFSRPVAPNIKNLTSSGINPDIAKDLLRRISQQQYRRLELKNLIQRSNSSERKGYSDALRELNKNVITLREELGEETYDQYLFTSGQDNRVKVSSVMAGSPAESSGFESDDIILLYDNRKIFGWADLQKATIQGEIGSYTSIDIMRNGERMSLMVPRGTLGIKLDTAQLDPSE